MRQGEALYNLGRCMHASTSLTDAGLEVRADAAALGFDPVFLAGYSNDHMGFVRRRRDVQLTASQLLRHGPRVRCVECAAMHVDGSCWQTLAAFVVA